MKKGYISNYAKVCREIEQYSYYKLRSETFMIKIFSQKLGEKIMWFKYKMSQEKEI